MLGPMSSGTPPLLRWSIGILSSGVAVVALLYVAAYCWMAAGRVPHPFELEWMEGGSVVHVQRVLDGEPLYIQPSLEFTPFIYTPLYYYASALMAVATGNGFLPLRLVAFLSSLGSLALIFFIVRRRTESVYAPLLASCLFAATFHIAGGWFDVARVDSFFLFLLLAGIYAFQSPRRVLRSWVSPLLIFFAFYTKQTALVVAVPLCLAALILRRGSERAVFPLIFGSLAAGALLLMNGLSDGWFGYYVFDLPRQHPIDKGMVFEGFWLRDLLSHLSVALCFSLIPLFHRVTSKAAPDAPRHEWVGDAAVLGGLVFASWFSRIHAGGAGNVLMPAYAGIAIYFGLGLGAALNRFSGAPETRLVLVAAAAFQFVGLFYWPGGHVPPPEDREQGEALLSLVSKYEGEVYWAGHPWYGAMIGKPTQAQEMAIQDVLRGDDDSETKQILSEEIRRAVRDARFDALVLDRQRLPLAVPELDANYVLVKKDLVGKGLRPVAGWKRKPTYLYERRPGRGESKPGS